MRASQGDWFFHAEEMREYVTQVVGEVAPGSPDRVMRALRQAGVIGYRVISRAESLYQIQAPEAGDDGEDDQWAVELE